MSLMPWGACAAVENKNDCEKCDMLKVASMRAEAPNGDPPLGVVYPSNAELGRRLGVTGVTIGYWRKEGCPNTSVTAARAWMENNKPRIGRHQAPLQDELPRPPIVLPSEEDPYALVQRLRDSEKAISGEIDGWLSVTLPGLVAERDKAKGKVLIATERKIAIVNHRISALRKEQRTAIAALLAAERDIVKLEYSRGKLISLDSARDLVSSAILPIIIAVRRMPESGEDDREKTRLRALSESLLAVAREAAREFVQIKLAAAGVSAA